MTDKETAIEKLERAISAIKKLPDHFEPLSINLTGKEERMNHAALVHVYVSDWCDKSLRTALTDYANMAGLYRRIERGDDEEDNDRIYAIDENGTILMQIVSKEKEAE